MLDLASCPPGRSVIDATSRWVVAIRALGVTRSRSSSAPLLVRQN